MHSSLFYLLTNSKTLHFFCETTKVIIRELLRMSGRVLLMWFVFFVCPKGVVTNSLDQAAIFRTFLSINQIFSQFFINWFALSGSFQRPISFLEGFAAANEFYSWILYNQLCCFHIDLIVQPVNFYRLFATTIQVSSWSFDHQLFCFHTFLQPMNFFLIS
jgi:hypothetical protein